MDHERGLAGDGAVRERVWLWLYFPYGRLATRAKAEAAMGRDEEMPSKRHTPSGQVAKGPHCGSGCTLGDIVAEWLVFLVPAVAVWFGWRSLFGERMFAVWVLDYIFAFALGIVFQYFTIPPMRRLSPGRGMWARGEGRHALADRLAGRHVRLHGLRRFDIFRRLLGARLETASPEFWFVMQLAMLCGFATAYPVNWWLIRSGIKEAM